MFERFHQDARRVVERARHEAALAGQGQIGCDHLLLGLLAVFIPLSVWRYRRMS